MNQPRKKITRKHKTGAENSNDHVTRKHEGCAVTEFNRLVGKHLAQKWLSERDALQQEKP